MLKTYNELLHFRQLPFRDAPELQTSGFDDEPFTECGKLASCHHRGYLYNSRHNSENTNRERAEHEHERRNTGDTEIQNAENSCNNAR